MNPFLLLAFTAENQGEETSLFAEACSLWEVSLHQVPEVIGQIFRLL